MVVPRVVENVTGSLVFSFYLRPNALVPDERACISQSFSKTVTVDNASLVAGDILTVAGVQITADIDFAIGANSSITAANLTTIINNLLITDTTASTNNNITVITYANRRQATVSSNPSGMLVQSTITVNTTNVPTDLTPGSLVDILQFDGGHSTLRFDVKLAHNSVSLTSLTFAESDLPDEFVLGDYICARYECIVPQIPTDLHMLLGERTAARILASLGDRESLMDAQKKIDRLEMKQATIIDNRVEGAPLKVTNRNGLLNSAKVKFGRRVR